MNQGTSSNIELHENCIFADTSYTYRYELIFSFIVVLGVGLNSYKSKLAISACYWSY